MAYIAVDGVQKRFGSNHVLRGITFTLKRGEGVVLLGSNGCGKSTLLRCMIGLEGIDGGTVTIDGISLPAARRAEIRALRRKVGVVFQKFNLVGNLSVFQNVLYGALGRQRLGLLGTLAFLAPGEERERAMACLERVGLAEKAGEPAESLSGGQQQRVAIARMLMQQPDIVLADEPIASLDPEAGRRVMDLLWEIIAESGMTVLCTLHQLEIATTYAERIIGMKAGHVVIDDRVANIPRAALDALYTGVTRTDEAPAEDRPERLAAE
jgi:phosphonate transport system ATP-binding protein